jgi:hypothetical protein
MNMNVAAGNRPHSIRVVEYSANLILGNSDFGGNGRPSVPKTVQRAGHLVMPWVDHWVLAGSIREDERPLCGQTIEHGEVMIVERQEVLAVTLGFRQP